LASILDKQYQMAVSDLATWMRTKYYKNVNVPIALTAGQARADRRTARFDHPDKSLRMVSISNLLISRAATKQIEF
jgi:hypothetical protein